MGALQVEYPPKAEPVDLATLKNHLRVTINNDDDLIKVYLQAARESLEDFLNRSLVNKGYRQSLDAFPYFVDTMMTQQAYPPSMYALPRYATAQWNYSQVIKLLISPLVKVTSITYTDTTGAVQTLLPAPFPWAAKTEFVLGDQVKDSNGNLQEVTAASESETGGASVSGSSAPSWNGSTGGTTTDGDLTWTNKGAAPAGDFVYDRDSEPPRIAPVIGSTWPPVDYTLNATQVHYVAGYGDDGTNVPALAKVCLMQMVGGWYENREPVSDQTLKEVPGNLQDILWSLRVLDFAPTRG
jgi:Phage gp6-like head-tail connector protein